MLSLAELIVSSSWPGQVWARFLAQDGQDWTPRRRPAPRSRALATPLRATKLPPRRPGFWHSVMLQSPRGRPWPGWAKSEVQPKWSKRH